MNDREAVNFMDDREAVNFVTIKETPGRRQRYKKCDCQENSSWHAVIVLNNCKTEIG
jgi:hypothetical protein